MLSILFAMLVMFILIGMFAYQSHTVSQPKVEATPAVSTLPTH